MAELSIGDEAPAFELPDTEGDLAFTRPTAGSRRRSSSPATTARTRWPGTTASWTSRATTSRSGARVLLISPNDAERYPRDSYEAMQQRVRDDGGWPAPYLYDETQEVARAYGAKTTPDVFVVDADGKLRYRGAPDADYNDPQQNAEWLRGALDAVLEGRDPGPGRDGPGRVQHQVEVSACVEMCSTRVRRQIGLGRAGARRRRRCRAARRRRSGPLDSLSESSAS